MLFSVAPQLLVAVNAPEDESAIPLTGVLLLLVTVSESVLLPPTGTDPKAR